MEGKIIRDIDYKVTTHRIIQYSTEEYKNSEKKRLESLQQMWKADEVIIDISKPDEDFYALEILFIRLNPVGRGGRRDER